MWRLKIYIFLFLCISVKAQIPVFNWAIGIGSGGSSFGYSIAYDVNGNVYTTGSFSGTVDFDPGPGSVNLTSAGSNDIFVCKVSSAGVFQWAKKFGGGGTGDGNSIAVDASGNVYTTGYFTGTADFDPGPGTVNFTALGSQDIFVSKLDASGNYVWARQLGGPSPDVAQAIAIDASGNVYTTGFTQGAGDYDPGPGVVVVNPIGSADAWISKLNSSGNFVWAKQLGGDNTVSGKTILTDAAGNLYIGGFHSGTTDFDPGAGVFPLTSSGSTDIFICKLNSSGNFAWAKEMGGTFSDYCSSLAVDASGNVYSTGAFQSTSDFDPGAGTFNLVSSGINDIFVSKLNSSGAFVWANKMGGTNDDIGESIKVDANGNVYTAGEFQGTVDFDPGVGVFNLTSAGFDDIFISKVNSVGTFTFALKVGGPSQDIAKSIDLDASGGVYTTGYYNGTADMDPGPGTYTMSSAGSSDILIHKLCPVPSTPTNVTAPLNQIICGGSSATLSANGSGTMNWFTSSSGGTVVGTGTSYITPTLSIGNYVFYAEATTCTTSATRAAIGVTVTPLPVYSVSTTIVLLCVGNTGSLVASGVTSCTWMPGNLIGTIVAVSPTVTTTYTAYGSNGGCANAVMITQAVSPCTSLIETAGAVQKIEIFPNPSSGIYHVRGLTSQDIIRLYNTTGQMIMEKVSSNDQLELDCSQFESGIYFIRVSSTTRCYTVRVMKK